jgi:hypothetical protein
MNISIKMVRKYPTKKNYIEEYKARITIGDFYETIEPAMDFWTKEDYERQWREGLDRLKTHNTSCLVARVHNPKSYKYLNWWVLYKDNNVVFVQNEMAIDEWYNSLIGDKSFTSESCYSFIRKRESKTERGTEISTWSVPYEE